MTEIVDEVRRTGNLNIINDLYAVDYDRIPVSPSEFLNGEYYIGSSVKYLADAWKKEFDLIFAPDSKITTLVLTGAIGTGKTTFASVCVARKIFELSCLKDPAQFFGLLPKTKIVFGMYNITLDKAGDISQLIANYVDTSPYFQENCQRKIRPQFPITFPSKNIEISEGSLASHSLGDNVLVFVIDEANFYKKSGQLENPLAYTRAHELFNSARTRLVSRFKRFGKVPGLVILISSKKFQSSFLDQFLEKVEKIPELAETTRIIDFALWQTKDPKNYCGQSFEVLVGSEQYDSRVLEEDEIIPEDCETVRVPTEHYEDFLLDTDLALRDIAGVSTSGAKAFFPAKSRLFQCVDKTRQHPFTKLSITLPFNKEVSDPGDVIGTIFNHKAVCTIIHSKWVPLVNPEKQRYVHIDIAYSQETLGFCMGHSVTLPNEKLGVYIDLMLRVKPPVIGEIDLTCPILFLMTLRDYGFNIAKVTFDQFQSRLPIQHLARAGFNPELLSANLAICNHAKICINEQRVSMYHYQPFLQEAGNLQKGDEGDRPHHPLGETDDVWDAVASVISQCYKVEHAVKTFSNKMAIHSIQPRNIGTLVVSTNASHGQDEFSIH